MSTNQHEAFETFVAGCSRAQAEQLLDYDHHYVWIAGRPGIILTYHWLPLSEAAEPLQLKIVFGAPALRHPPAPASIQAIVAQLQLVPIPSAHA